MAESAEPLEGDSVRGQPGAYGPRYERPTHSPVLVGDELTDGALRSVTSTPTNGECRGDDRQLRATQCVTDRAVIDELMSAVPEDLPVLREMQIKNRTATAAPRQLRPGESLYDADDIRPDLRSQLNALLEAHEDWATFAREVVRAVDAAGHLVWIIGGPVRDVVQGRPVSEVNDLDLAGSATPEVFLELLERVLIRLGLAGMEIGCSPGSLVCWVRDTENMKRLLEYKPLAEFGFHFPACGNDFGRDVATRDFSWNALFYDPQRGQLIDPLGTGVADLLAIPRKFRVAHGTDKPVELLNIAIRAIKFIHRERSRDVPVEIDPVREWLAQISPELVVQLSEPARNDLGLRARKQLQDVPTQDAWRIADELHPVTRQVLEAVEPFWPEQGR